LEALSDEPAGAENLAHGRAERGCGRLPAFGMMPLAIADYLGLSDATTAGYLREAEER
jgi:hypothetical protein